MEGIHCNTNPRNNSRYLENVTGQEPRNGIKRIKTTGRHTCQNGRNKIKSMPLQRSLRNKLYYTTRTSKHHACKPQHISKQCQTQSFTYNCNHFYLQTNSSTTPCKPQHEHTNPWNDHCVATGPRVHSPMGGLGHTQIHF